jgi:cysteinyl-tRNA synthetase
VLGLLQREPEAFLQGRAGAGPTDADILQKIEARLAARKAKNYAEADRIRKDLEAAGVILEDGPKGTTWRRA